jgi:RimJ/RimL family protein N-acetyltransferase
LNITALRYDIWSFHQLVELFNKTALYDTEPFEGGYHIVTKTHSFLDHIEYLRFDFERTCDKSGYVYAVALDGDRLVGVRKMNNNDLYKQWVSGYISVDPIYWQQGVATQLNHIAGAFLQKHGISTLMLFSESEKGQEVGMIGKTTRILAEYGITCVKGP